MGGVRVVGVVLLAFAAAAVRSQCFLMNMGMSWKARKRCVLICALDWSQYAILFPACLMDRYLDSLIREIARMLRAVINSALLSRP